MEAAPRSCQACCGARSKQGMAAAALDHDAADFDEQDVLYDESDRVDSEASEAEAEPAAEPASDSEEEELLDMDQDEGGLTIEGTVPNLQQRSTAALGALAAEPCSHRGWRTALSLDDSAVTHRYTQRKPEEQHVKSELDSKSRGGGQACSLPAHGRAACQVFTSAGWLCEHASTHVLRANGEWPEDWSALVYAQVVQPDNPNASRIHLTTRWTQMQQATDACPDM